jgi:hypothetical protein
MFPHGYKPSHQLIPIAHMLWPCKIIAELTLEAPRKLRQVSRPCTFKNSDVIFQRFSLPSLFVSSAMLAPL